MTDYFAEAFMTKEDWGRRIGHMTNRELKQSLLIIAQELDNKAANHPGMIYPGSIQHTFEYSIARKIERLAHEIED